MRLPFARIGGGRSVRARTGVRAGVGGRSRAALLLLLPLSLTSVQDGGHRVIRVIDGDTIEIEYRGRRERLRYIGIDTPETVHPRRGVEPYGLAADRANRRLVEGETVRLEFDVQTRDRYGRLLSYVWVDSIFVNEWLVRNGYAQIATYPPNVRYVERFREAQRRAREEGRGLWGVREPGPVRARTLAPLEMHHQPNASSEVVTVLPVGSLVELDECRGRWCRVRYETESGWVAKRHLEEAVPP